MTSEYIIRKAEMKDINDIIRINKICLPENYTFDFFYRILSEYGYACAVAEIDDEITGYVLSRIEKPFSSIIGLNNTKGHIISVAVLPQHRRKNIAHQMMKFVMQKMNKKNIDIFYLEVRKSNKAAINLYEKLEYKIKREIKHYYRDGESAIVMEWNKED